MRPPIRKVCGGCLRSVEFPSPDSEDPGILLTNECPHCGGEIESRSDPNTPSPNDFGPTDSRLAPANFSPVSDETIDWAETWNRGTLGVIGRYQLRERLGEGGFGQVFQAFDPRLDRDVALKVLKQPNPTERVMQRFFREARAAARLDHPNIVAVHDAGYENGRCWIAYQYISGRPLWWYRNHHPMDALTAARVIRQLADALDHAHHMGVLHRDLKPANVIMDDHGRPRLTDFGLARRADLDSSLTRDGAMVGTPAYMSPEQERGNSKNIDERSDIYSLGVIFHELLHGRRPRESGDEPEPSTTTRSAEHGIGRRFRRGSESQIPIPASLKRICDKALASTAELRYPNARSFAEDIDRWLNLNRARSSARQRLTIPAMVGASLMLLACGGLVVALSPFRMRQAQHPEFPNQPATNIQGLAEAQDPVVDLPKGSIAPFPQPTTPKPLTTSVAANASSLVANRLTRVYHKAGASCIRNMLEHNRAYLESTDQAIGEGYRPCEKCFRE